MWMKPTTVRRAMGRPTPNVHLSIDYDEDPKRPSYRSVVVRGPGRFESRYASNDPVTDFRKGLVLARRKARVGRCRLLASSSLTHFVFDVPGYRFVGHPVFGELLARDPRDGRRRFKPRKGPSHHER